MHEHDQWPLARRDVVNLHAVALGIAVFAQFVGPARLHWPPHNVAAAASAKSLSVMEGCSPKTPDVIGRVNVNATGWRQEAAARNHLAASVSVRKATRRPSGPQVFDVGSNATLSPVSPAAAGGLINDACRDSRLHVALFPPPIEQETHRQPQQTK